MIFGSKNKNVLKNVGADNVKIIEIYKKGSRTFQLYCDVKKSQGTIANNTNYCISLLTDNGFVMLVDNRNLDIPEVKLEMGEEKLTEQIEAGFAEFKKYADIVV